MNKFRKYKVLLLILTASVASSGIGVFSKISLNEMSPFLFVFLRFAIALIFLLPIIFIQKESLSLSAFRRVLPVSLLGTGNIIFFILGIKFTSASSGQMLYTVAPLIAGIISYFLLAEKLTFNKITGIIIGFLGALIIILLPVLDGKASISGGTTGNLVILASVLSFAFYSVFSKQYQKKYKPLPLTVYYIITTLLVALFFILINFKANMVLPSGFSRNLVYSLMYVGILGTGVYYLVYQYAVKEATPVVASMTLYLQPIFTIIWAMILLNESLTIAFIAGTVLAFAGVALVTTRQDKTC